MSHWFVACISWAAVLVGVLAMGVQSLRVTRLGVEGVSSATWLLFTLNGGFWIAYGALSAHSYAVIWGSLLCLPFQLSIVFRLAPWRHRRGSSQAIAMFVATCVVPGALGGWSYCVYGCGVSMTLLRAPQFLELLRTRDASGVSATSWLVGASGAALWIAYYANVHLWAPLVATVASGAASLVVATMAVWRHRQADEEFVRREVFAI